MQTTWKPVVGYEDSYEISNHGEVFSLPRNGTRKFRRAVRPDPNGTGYLNIRLSKNNVSKTYKLHRLVALAFIPNPNNKPQVNHKDGNKLNNNVKNLEWVTAQENYQHAIQNGLVKVSQEDNPKAKLTIEDVKKIRELCKEKKLSQKEIGNLFNITQAQVSIIHCRKQWQFV